MRLTLACLPLVTGCVLSNSDERVAPISEFNLLTTISDTARITFEHYGEDLDSLDCLILPDDVTASLAGMPLEIVTRGGQVGSGCEFPSMILNELPEADAAVLTVGPYRCPLGDTLVRFGVELVPPGPWTLAAGGTYTVRAIKPADTMKLSAHVVVGPSMFPTQLGSAPSGDTLQITIPAHFRGDYELRVLARHDDSISATRTCGGFLFTSHQARQPVVVTGS